MATVFYLSILRRHKESDKPYGEPIFLQSVDFERNHWDFTDDGGNAMHFRSRTDAEAAALELLENSENWVSIEPFEDWAD